MVPQTDEVAHEETQNSRKRARSPTHDAMLTEKMTLRKRARKNYVEMVNPQSKSILGKCTDQPDYAFGV
jgi:hypothetical protein